MAEAVLVVGGVASFIQIAATLTSLTRKLKRCLRILRYAPKEVEQLRREMSEFSFCLQWFGDQAHGWLQKLEGSPKKARIKKHLTRMEEGCKAVVGGLKTLLRKLFLNRSQNSSLEAFIDRIRWYFREPQVKGLRLGLQSTKSSVTLFMTLIIFEDLTRTIKELEGRLQEVPQELKMRM